MNHSQTLKTINQLTAGCLLAGTLLLTSSTSFGQAVPGTKEDTSERESLKQSIAEQEVQLLRMDIRAQRKKIVATNLPLTEDEAVKFWPVYDQYIGEMVKINDVRFDLITQYAANYTTMTDELAASFIQKWIESDKSMVELRLKYIPIVEKVLPPKKSAIFFQIDRRCQLLMDLQITRRVPLMLP